MFEQEYEQLNLEKSGINQFNQVLTKFEQFGKDRTSKLKQESKVLLDEELKQQKEKAEEMLEKYKLKKLIINDCLKLQKEKNNNIQKVDS